MGPRGTPPKKSIFWSQKWHFPDFLFRGSVEGRGGCKTNQTSRSRFWGKEDATKTKQMFSEQKGYFSEKGGGIQWMRGLVRISTGKAIHWRGPGHSVNRRTLKRQKLLSSPSSRTSALNVQEHAWGNSSWLISRVDIKTHILYIYIYI